MIQQPTPRKTDFSTIVHGYALADPYHWLKQKDTQEVLDYLHAENAYMKQYMSSTEQLQEQLYAEMRGRIKEQDSTVPEKSGEYLYYSRTEEGKQYRIFCRKKDISDSQEEVILDANQLAEGHPYFVLGNLKLSPNHRFIAYSCDMNGSEHFSIYVKDLTNGTIHPEVLHGADTSIEWFQDSYTFLYLSLDSTRRAYKVFRHHLGTEQEADALLIHETDEAFFLGLDSSRDGAYLFADASSKTTSEVWMMSANDTNTEFYSIMGRTHNHEYYVSSYGSTLYILSNDQAKNFRLMVANIQTPSVWTEFIPHRPETRLQWVFPYATYIIIGERTAGITGMRIQSISDIQDFYYPDFPEPVYEIYPGKNYEPDSETFRIHYSSPITPPSVYNYHVSHKHLELLKRDTIKGDYNPEDYITERHYAEVEHGVKVPLTITRKRNCVLNGQSPAFMIGYGSYGFSLPPSFSSSIISLMNRGFICVKAHIRGGGDMGEQWYLDGKLKHKKNTFTDFIACAEYLINNKFTSADRLAVQGGSAGGLLMGAIANMRPDLFACIVASVPFVDLMNTMLDSTLPLTIAEYEEWGNPHQQEDFEYMLSYSPYDNISHQSYPHILAIAGYHDQRVSYWEPAKWIAKLRDFSTSESAILLYTKFSAGHFGASGRFDYLKELALEYAFILKHIPN